MKIYKVMIILHVKKNNAKLCEKKIADKVTFAKYYSPTCPACIAMESDWDDMCKDIEQKYNTDMILADIDGNAMVEMNDVYNDIEYVPTIILLKNGKKVKEYNGPKKKDDMINFLMNEGVLKSSMRGGKKRKTRRRKSVKRRTKRKTRKSRKSKKSRKN